ncbi:MAG TPA: antibiotic biosynthesis monooxygenase [Terrimicrobiaceae bacterium]
MSTPSVLIATAKVRPGADGQFAAWKARHDMVIGKFPGLVSSDILAPAQPNRNEWTIILNFRSKEDLAAWQQSRERVAIIAEGAPLFEGGNFREIAQIGEQEERGDVTEVIFSRIKADMEDTYREWAVRIQAAQAKYPGYRGMFLQPPEKQGGLWTTIIRFDSASHLEAWMDAPERKELLRESEAFIEHEQFTRLATSFPGWVPLDPKTGKGPPNWKTAMLVLLGLFPVVMLELKFLSPSLSALSIHASLATFIGNSISVAVTSFLTMPWCVRWFGWWLFPSGDFSATTARGVLLLAGLYALEVLALWGLLPW